MKWIYSLTLLSVLVLAACNSTETAETETTSDSSLPDPAAVQPPDAAIPDSMKLANDSVILPDITPPQKRGLQAVDSQ